MCRYGYVHCDPHPGNVLVQKEPHTGEVKIVLLDHGLYTVRKQGLPTLSLTIS